MHFSNETALSMQFLTNHYIVKKYIIQWRYVFTNKYQILNYGIIYSWPQLKVSYIQLYPGWVRNHHTEHLHIENWLSGQLFTGDISNAFSLNKKTYSIQISLKIVQHGSKQWYVGVVLNSSLPLFKSSPINHAFCWRVDFSSNHYQCNNTFNT